MASLALLMACIAFVSSARTYAAVTGIERELRDPRGLITCTVLPSHDLELDCTPVAGR